METINGDKMGHYIYRYITMAVAVWFAILSCAAQDYYWVEFSDKNGSPYTISEPEEYLSDAAIERRRKQGIEIDSTDLPVNPYYIYKVVGYGASYVHQSKWLNGITIRVGDDSAIDSIKALPFVKKTECSKRVSQASRIHKILDKSMRKIMSDGGSNTKITTDLQNRLTGCQFLSNHGFRGKGKRIAVFDTGFPLCNTDMYVADKIKAAYNIAYPSMSAFDESLHKHGSYCLAVMAAEIDNQYIGTAPESEYFLFVTEDNSTESWLEIDNWVRAAEMADSIGADVINASLGYSDMDDWTTNIPYSDLDGKTVRCSVAASMAAKKGMVVCVSAGNEAAKTWHYITSPADADGILTVGAVTESGEHSSFSSFGPTVDGRVKPTICTLGTQAALYYDGTVFNGNGTSFASPQAAGAVASLWSALPNMTSAEIVRLITETASNYHNPNDSTGYGIADFERAYYKAKATETSKSIIVYKSGTDLIITNPENNEISATVYSPTGHVIRQTIKGRKIYIPLTLLPNGIYVVRCSDGSSLKVAI